MTTITQGRILKKLAKGAVIRVEYTNHPPSSARRVYRLTPGNKLLREQTVKCLLDDRLIRPAADGLFLASEGGA